MYEQCSINANTYDYYKKRSVNDKQIKAWIMQDKQRSLRRLHYNNKI